MNYTFTDHLHNYAVWTAARAQRAFTTNKNIQAAINSTDLKNLIGNDENPMTLGGFDRFHSETANKIIKSLSENGMDASYGRAAKLIAIYLKTAIVIKHSGSSGMAKIIHPPIDSILLKNLHKQNPNLGLSKTKWSQLSEEEYFVLINKFRALGFEYFWELEQYWTPVRG